MRFDIYAPGARDLAPGEARCPGPSVQDTLDADGDAVPAPLRVQAYEFLGDEDIPLERYTSGAFYERELEKVWSKTWQWACREEHVPRPGDYYVYDVAQYSVLVVRDHQGTVRAFVNSCPHRGMQLAESGSMGYGKQFLRCPFHGMSWHLDGRLKEIPCRWDFPHVQDACFGLDAVRCDTWGGFVFINLDRNAAPLEEYLEVLPEHFADWRLENRYVVLHTEKVLPGNWKMCMEGFMEAYHVLATHPEGLRFSAWANTQYDLLSPHVSRFIQTLNGGNPHFEREFTEAQIYQNLGYRAEDLPEGRTARQQHADHLRRSLGEEMGADLSGVPTSLMLDSIEYHVFPNACFFPGINIPLIYRFRPMGVDRCIHDIMLLRPVPDSGKRPEPARVVRLEIDEPYVSVESFRSSRLSYVLDQDTDNFRRQWRGIEASRKGRQTLGNYQECRIRHFHRTLDSYLER
jgi:phenylpropionate dioxygenase-like ring-hydroxylating dioxygenase large terminal subunit